MIIAIASGKGGTGKTMLSASFVTLASECTIADCDVDAANMHLMLNPVIKERNEFKSWKKALIDKTKCISCGLCIKACRFDAINNDYIVDSLSCEGCGLCARICPVEAIEMKTNKAGEWFISNTIYGTFIHAKLGIAEENSGKLVSKVRMAAEKKGHENSTAVVIIDGPPGTGCPVMSTLTGTDFVVIVTEPTVSGVHDLKRAAEVAWHFKVPYGVIINKYDINPEKTEEIEKYCFKNEIKILGKVSFNKCVVEAINSGIPPIKYCNGQIAEEIKNCWENIKIAAG